MRRYAAAGRTDTGASHGLHERCPNCGGETTLWGSDVPEAFGGYPVTNCEECLILLDA